MSLKRASDQSPETLHEFYQDLATPREKNQLWEYGQQMLELLPLLENLCADLPVWGLTSHAALCLLAEDVWHSPWYVQVDAQPMGTFHISYSMPDAEAPWPHARVKGTGKSKEEAIEMIRTAMLRSGGWPSMADNSSEK